MSFIYPSSFSIVGSSYLAMDAHCTLADGTHIENSVHDTYQVPGTKETTITYSTGTCSARGA